MRKILLLFGVFCVVLHAYTYANTGTDPEPKISINGTYTLKAIFGIIRTQTGKEVSYASTVLNDRKKVKVNLLDASVDEVLSAVLRGLNLSWKKSEQYITLYKQVEVKAGAVVPAQVADTLPVIVLTGTVRDTAGNPLPGASIQIQGTRKGTSADGAGSFRLADVAPNSIIQVGFTGYESKIVSLAGNEILNVILNVTVKDLQGVSVYSTGYQKVPKERATGSFVQVDNKLYNRKVGSSILDRLDGVTSSLSFNKNIGSQYGQSNISIRGRSTILGNAEPLIVVDNFPYDGNIASLNPNDVESVTILRDAAASSIWGTRAGNGVIVITTKKGEINQRPTIEFNSNITFAEKPNLFYYPQMSTREYIDAEKYLFSKGAYDVFLQFLPYYYSSPAIDILYQHKQNLITESEQNDRLEDLAKYDVRKDLQKYFYRNSTNQQYAVNISGGTTTNQYYYSFGYDKSMGEIVKSANQRFSFSGKNNIVIVKDRLDIGTNVLFSKTINDLPYLPELRTPYGRLRDENGKSAAVTGDLRMAYTDTAGLGRLLDWKYKPLDEYNNVEYQNKFSDLLVSAFIKYKILKGLHLQLLYQYGNGSAETNNYYSEQSFYVRNLVNKYAAVNPQSGGLMFNIPKGAILDHSKTQYEINNIRLQFDFSRRMGRNSINTLGGFERRTNTATFVPEPRLYGFNSELQTYSLIDYLKTYPQFYEPGSLLTIPNNNLGTLRQVRRDNNISYYINASYNFDNLYTLTFSARKDESNIFGVESNNKGVPLYSVGVSWAMSNSKFYHLTWLPYLKSRLTFGYSGNIDKSSAAFLTAQASSAANVFNQPYIFVRNPPNPQLGWEKIGTTNLGIDFAFLNNIISGSIDFFVKKGKDMIGDGMLAPSAGVIQYRGNVANIKGKGFDLVLNSINVKKSFKWSTNFLLSFATEKITSYDVKPARVNDYMAYIGYYPAVGKPVQPIFSYRWGGLDGTTGAPMGIVDGKPSTDYGKITGSNDFNTHVYNGPANPPFTSSIRNNFSFKEIELSFNIVGKFGYYFRRPSLDYSTLLNPNMPLGYYSPDYNKRWRNPGDEKVTSVPSAIYPEVSGSTALYNYSEILVEKGDHIRLQDIQLSYSLLKFNPEKRIKEFRVYAFINNVGILWRNNDYNIDPDFVPGNQNTYPQPRSYAIGINAKF